MANFASVSKLDEKHIIVLMHYVCNTQTFAKHLTLKQKNINEKVSKRERESARTDQEELNTRIVNLFASILDVLRTKLP